MTVSQNSRLRDSQISRSYWPWYFTMKRSCIQCIQCLWCFVFTMKLFVYHLCWCILRLMLKEIWWRPALPIWAGLGCGQEANKNEVARHGNPTSLVFEGLQYPTEVAYGSPENSLSANSDKSTICFRKGAIKRGLRGPPMARLLLIPWSMGWL